MSPEAAGALGCAAVVACLAACGGWGPRALAWAEIALWAGMLAGCAGLVLLQAGAGPAARGAAGGERGEEGMGGEGMGGEGMGGEGMGGEGMGGEDPAGAGGGDEEGALVLGALSPGGDLMVLCELAGGRASPLDLGTVEVAQHFLRHHIRMAPPGASLFVAAVVAGALESAGADARGAAGAFRGECSWEGSELAFAPLAEGELMDQARRALESARERGAYATQDAVEADELPETSFVLGGDDAVLVVDGGHLSAWTTAEGALGWLRAWGPSGSLAAGMLAGLRARPQAELDRDAYAAAAGGAEVLLSWRLGSHTYAVLRTGPAVWGRPAGRTLH